MKKKLFFPSLRVLFGGVFFFGILLVWTSFQSYETIASLLNKFADDGSFESFTLARFQALKIPLLFVGLLFSVIATLALAWWRKTQEYLDRLFKQAWEFNNLFLQDARTFFRDIRDAFVRLGRLDAIILTGLMAAAAAIRLAELNIPLIADEAYTYNAFASKSLWQTVSDYHLPNNHVFLSVMINLITHLFGNQVWLIRLPTLIAGVLMVPAAYFLAQRLYGRDVAVLSAALVTVYPILVTYSVLARGYGIISLITLLILILGDRVLGSKDHFAWFLLIVLSAVGFYTVPIMLFPFGALYLWLFMSHVIDEPGPYRSKWEFSRYWLTGGFASALLTVVLYAPILIKDSDRFFKNKFVAPLGSDMLLDSLWSRIQVTWLEWTFSVPGWAAVLGVIGLILGLVFHNRISKQKIIPLQLAFLIWIAVVLVILRPDMKPRMWLLLVAPLLIWSASGLVGVLQWLSGAFRRNVPLARIFTIVMAFLVLLFGLNTVPTIPNRWSQKSSYERTVIYLKDHLREGDLVNASTDSLSQLRYYFGVYDIPLEYVRRSGKFQRAFLAIGRETDTLEKIAPVDGSNRPLIDLKTARVVLEFDGLILYESYPAP
ncbi:MAG: glycosyltransferase family 39 protein [Chloroflexi bacterium]|nr:glycosyltransferase family 39 protein [Chloroflexota bacterium]